MPKARDQKIEDLPVKLAAPARRALTNADIATLGQLAALTETEVAALHGIGPNAVVELKRVLKAHGLAFAK